MPTVDPQPWQGGGEDSHSTRPRRVQGGRPVFHRGQETRPCPWAGGKRLLGVRYALSLDLGTVLATQRV